MKNRILCSQIFELFLHQFISLVHQLYIYLNFISPCLQDQQKTRNVDRNCIPKMVSKLCFLITFNFFFKRFEIICISLKENSLYKLHFHNIHLLEWKIIKSIEFHMHSCDLRHQNTITWIISRIIFKIQVSPNKKEKIEYLCDT